MVAALIGAVDGNVVEFRRSENPDVWLSTIPAKKSGLVVLELKAYDEAGNESNWDGVLCLIDYDALTVTIIPDRYTSAGVNADFLFRPTSSFFMSREIPVDKCNAIEPPKFIVKELM
jgi:hypothetical protein